MKSILLIFVILSTYAFARQNPEFMEFGLAKEDSRLKGKKTNFHVKIGAGYINYVNSHKFNGTIEQFKEQDEPIVGPDISFGYQILLYGPLSLTINANWFHLLKNDNDIDNAESGSIDEKISELNRNYKTYGGGFSASLNYEFQAKGLVWQPFFELGGGTGKSTYEIDYERFLTNETETYQATFTDSFSYLNTGVGINAIAESGIFSYLKISLIQFLDIKRSFNGTEKTTNAGSTNLINRSEQPDNFSSLSYTLGMGYTF